MSRLDAAFAALADPTRRAVIRLLIHAPRRAGELSESLDVQPSALTRHLRVLRESGLVAEERPAEDARGRVYRLRREPLTALHRWIDEVETFWTGQLESFRDHAEGRSAPHPRARR